jgi:hypothetical protein
LPDSFSEFPAVAVRFKSGNYTDATFTFSILLVVAGWDIAETELELHPYLDSTGTDSMKLALDAYAGCTVVVAGRSSG